MLSLHQAIEIKESILAYLKATFTFQDKMVHKAFYEFVNNPKEGMFKGPYLSLRLPFVKANKEETEEVPLEIKPNWPPYDHQVKSWHRLSSYNKNPQSTIVTTGTGSGKTESFMYPILDYCHRNKHRQGIKVIILYPMNALATDQAKRLAEIICEDDRLKGNITAGLFIGEGVNAAKYPKSMGDDHIIENRESILSSPPDILLTNFKMLDYGLMKHNYHDLWMGNIQDKELLQYLVLDELHTYDGAQGTDVANLIRRLKLKIDVPDNHLCAVGTSATIGSGAEAPLLLSEYASKIFGETISIDSIITENRVNPTDYLGEDEDLEPFLPRSKSFRKINPLPEEGYDAYIQRQILVWQVDPENLATDLSKLKIVKDLVVIINEGEGIKTIDEITFLLSNKNKIFRDIPQWNNEFGFNPKESLIQSLFALISEAKQGDKKKFPFLYTQIQIWIRELSGVLREFSDEPKFVWKDSVSKEEDPMALPPWFCRECGASGWLGVKNDNKEIFEKDILHVYEKFFSNDKSVYFVNRTECFSQQNAIETGYVADDTFREYVYNRNFEFFDSADEGRIDVTAFRKLRSNKYNENKKNDHVCPECNSRNTVSIIGTRTPTLSSIAVSQTLATNLDARNEKQRKVLAFTNSVQDAAHQAGFIEARNYRFTFRSSLQKVINEMKEATPLDVVVDKFIKYWKKNSDETGDNPLDAYYYRFYPKDYIGISSPKDYIVNNRYTIDFQKEFDLRVRWEAYTEFGYNALIGRTLEKTGSSGVFFDKDALEEVWMIIATWLDENELSKTIERAGFIRFLTLILHRIRIRGAISHCYLDKFRECDLKLWELSWNKDDRHFLNKRFGPQTRIPRLLTTQPEGKGVLDSTFTRNVNWFKAYYLKTFQIATQHIDFLNEFYEKVIESLFQVGVLDKKSAKEHNNYALNPNKLFTLNKVYKVVCNKCGHEIHTADDSLFIVGGKCINFRCQGTYVDATKEIDYNYYQLVYNRKRSPRIYSADHTGLLERDNRETLENDFKQRASFNSINALVATSTLEMGIDIGSLNVAFNNSIPPLPSNFLQRVGRAGRSSGSALIVNFAQSKAHDLFYFQDPMDMMAGEVNTPGCYLEAKEILKRHFFAFCIDSWTSSNYKENIISSKVRDLNLEYTNIMSSEFFMNRILNFLKVDDKYLLFKFRSMYVGDSMNETFRSLEGDLFSDSFYTYHKSIFDTLKNEMLQIRSVIQRTVKYIKENRLGKNDPDRIELDNEIKSLGGIIKSIKDRQVLEHLTNIGALPNYAFHGKGVTLNAKVIGKKPIGGDNPPLNKEFEIVRSPGQALREFAPDNYFYSQGYKFKISGVNVFDWSKDENCHKKRFCSNCDYIEIEELSEKGNCPKCGHESWSAASNVHVFAKLESVKSFNNESDASLTDGNDDRDIVVFNNIRHFNFKNSTSSGAWVMKEVPFGIEYVKNVVITDCNLGRTDSIDARKIKINEEEVPTHGFITCKHCGKSSSNLYQHNYKQHYGYCKYKDSEYLGCADAVFEEVFFYKEMETEALKILLPVQEFNSEAEIKMFRAGIELGFRKYFKGNPQHIVVSDYKEYNHKTLRFDRYLILFDSISGGTGYLEKLFDWKEFNDLLYKAYLEIKECNCQHQGKDGCYHCIYSYTNQYYQKDLSRVSAEKHFEDIIKLSEGWEYQIDGLGSITNTGRIEESELESRFVRSFKKLSKNDNTWSYKEISDHGIINYILEYNNENKTSLTYHIRPQVNLGPNDDVAYNTRTDFLIICTEAILNGKVIEDLYEIPRFAIYLDGFQYHASKEHNRFENDIKKRNAINANSQYKTWTLTWDDLDRFDVRFSKDMENVNKTDILGLRLKEDGFKASKDKLIAIVRKDEIKLHKAENSFERLIKLLEYPLIDQNFRKSWSMFLGMFQKKLFIPSYDFNDINAAFDDSIFIESYCSKNRTLNGLVLFDVFTKNNLCSFKTLVNIDKSQVYSRLKLANIEDINKEEWNSFWIVYNLIQFFDLTVDDGVPEVSSSLYQLDDLLSQFDIVYHSILKDLYKKGMIKSEEDEINYYSLIDDDGEEIANAEFIIPHLKIVFQPSSSSDIKCFEKLDYVLKSNDELKDIKI